MGIRKSTLEHHKNKKIITPGCLGQYGSVLNADFEAELVEHCIQMQNRLFGLTIRDLRSMAYQLAEKNNLQHDFDEEKTACGQR